VPGRVDLQYGVAQVFVGGLAEGHFKGGESLPAGTVFPFLTQLHKGLPRPVAVLPIAIVAHLPLDLKDDRNSLLDGHLTNVGPDSQPEFETHAVRFRPDPGSVDDVNFVVGLVRMPLLVEYRYVLEANCQ